MRGLESAMRAPILVCAEETSQRMEFTASGGGRQRLRRGRDDLRQLVKNRDLAH